MVRSSIRIWLSISLLMGFGKVTFAQTYSTATVTINGVQTGAASGSMTVGFNGHSETVPYGPFSTASSIASAFAASFSADPISEPHPKLCGNGVCAKANGPVITFQVRSPAALGPITTSSSSTPGTPSNPFQATPGNGTASGTQVTGNLIYQYQIVQPNGSSGYDPTGNVIGYNDTVNGAWALGYDSLNRLTSSVAAPINSGAQFGCWAYDSFGNMQTQALSSQPITATGNNCQTQGGAVNLQSSYQYNASNQITSGQWLDASKNTHSGSPQYDAAGNMTSDLLNMYLYDAEGRVCAVNTGGGITGYLYNAEGQRVAKGMLPSMTCDPRQLQVTSMYFIGPDGEAMTEVDGQGNWVRTEVSAAGMHLATYTPTGIHYPITDWLGSKRVVVNPNLALNNGVEETCTSNPFGDGLNCSTSLDASPRHFTGKERDAESGLDYFGARYYASNMGRWMSPDSAPIPDTVPFADFGNPQSLNLYTYVGNNPLRGIDPDGHAYNICDQNGNCQNGVSDKDFDQRRADSVHAGEQWAGGNITLADGSSGGKYTWLGDDLPGDAASNRAGAQMIATDGNGAINFLLGNMAIQVGTAGLGVAVEAGADAIQAARAAQMMGRVAAAGRAGEAAVSAIEDIGVKKAIQVGGRTFIPDGMTATTLNEVKNVANLSYTAQLRAFAQYAGANNMTFQLWVRSSTVLSGPLQDAVSAGTIALRTF